MAEHEVQENPLQQRERLYQERKSQQRESYEKNAFTALKGQSDLVEQLIQNLQGELRKLRRLQVDLPRTKDSSRNQEARRAQRLIQVLRKGVLHVE